jgi:PKD repeat protein
MKKVLVLLAIVLLASSLLPSCKKKEIAPVASIVTNVVQGYAPLTVDFTSNSTGNISTYYWDFGNGGTSSNPNPTFTYSDAGTYTATLTVTGPGGSDRAEITINVFQPSTDITFINPTFTDITVTINGGSQTASPGYSVTFYSVAGTSVDFSAYTYGTDGGGTQVGEEIDWNQTLSLSGGTASYTLNASNTYFFLNFTNSGNHTLNELYVNYGLSDQTYDNITIPNDGIKYAIGYYYAFSNSNLRMYWEDNPSMFTYWAQGSDFTLPFTDNQFADISFTIKSNKNNPDNSKGSVPVLAKMPGSRLKPAKSFSFKENPKSIQLYSKRK